MMLEMNDDFRNVCNVTLSITTLSRIILLLSEIYLEI